MKKTCKPESPANQIAMLKRFDNGTYVAEYYRIVCECSDIEHDADMWIEVDTEEDSVSLAFFVTPCIPKRTLWLRIKSAWSMLLTGTTMPQQAELLLNKQGAANLAEVIKKAAKLPNNR